MTIPELRPYQDQMIADIDVAFAAGYRRPLVVLPTGGEAVDGQGYLERIARKVPRTFCALLGRVLPMTLNGEVRHDVSVELQAILQAHDGHTRSSPARANGELLHEPGMALTLLDS